MTDIDHALDAAITGAFAVALVDHESGLTLGSRGGGPGFGLDVAAPGDSEVVRAEIEVLERLGLRETVEDILITLDTRYHLVRPVRARGEDRLFFHLALDRAQANLAVARHELRGIATGFDRDDPSAAPRTADEQGASPAVSADVADPTPPVGAGTVEEPVGPAQEEVPAAVDGADGLPRAGSGGPGERPRPAAGERGRQLRAGRLLRRLRAAALLAEPSADRIAR